MYYVKLYICLTVCLLRLFNFVNFYSVVIMLKQVIDDLNQIRWRFADCAKDAIIMQNNDEYMSYTRFYAVLKQLVDELRNFDSQKKS